MPGPGQSLSVTLSRCSLRPSLAAILAASCDLLALLPGLRIHATVIAHGISDWISTGSLRQCFNILPRALSGSRAALCAPRCPHTPVARTRCPHTMGPLCRALRACSAAASCAARVPAHGLSQVALRVASSVPARGPSHALKPLRADPPAHTRALCSCACSFC